MHLECCRSEFLIPTMEKLLGVDAPSFLKEGAPEYHYLSCGQHSHGDSKSLDSKTSYFEEENLLSEMDTPNDTLLCFNSSPRKRRSHIYFRFHLFKLLNLVKDVLKSFELPSQQSCTKESKLSLLNFKV